MPCQVGELVCIEAGTQGGCDDLLCLFGSWRGVYGGEVPFAEELGRLLWAGMVQALARCLRRHTFSVRAAVPVDTRTAHIVNREVIMVVRTKASGLMPAMGVPRIRTTMTKIASAAISAVLVLAIRIVQR